MELGFYRERFSIDAVLQYWIYTESDQLKIDLEDAFEFDASLNTHPHPRFIPSLHVNAYVETDDLRVDGVRQANTRGYRFGLGPKLSYLAGDMMFSLTWVHDLEAENMLKGDWVYGRIAIPF